MNISEKQKFFDEEQNRISETVSKIKHRIAVFSVVDAVSGGAREYIWISDGDEGTCERCSARGGDIGTLQYHAAKGLPGPMVCKGGDFCRCELVPVD